LIDIQSPTAEIRRGKEEDRRQIEITGQIYTVSQKNQSTIISSITSPNVDRFSKFVH